MQWLYQRDEKRKQLEVLLEYVEAINSKHPSGMAGKNGTDKSLDS